MHVKNNLHEIYGGADLIQ